MGKYTKVTRNLPRAVRGEDDTTFRSRVDALKEEVDIFGAGNLANHYGFLRRERAEVEAQSKDLYASITAVEELLREAFEDAGVVSVTTEIGDKVATHSEPQATVTDRDAVREWYKSNGLERLLNPAPGNLAAIVRERLVDADEPLPGVTVKVYTKTVFTKGK